MMQVYQGVKVVEDGAIGQQPGAEGGMVDVMVKGGAVGVVVGVFDPVAVKFTNAVGLDYVIEIAASDLRVL